MENYRGKTDSEGSTSEGEERWEDKQNKMKNKNKLRGRQIYIEHDLTLEKCLVEKTIRDRTRDKGNKGKLMKASYYKIRIDYVGWVCKEKPGKL